MPIEEYLTPAEVAEAFRVPRETVDRLTASGELESLKFGTSRQAVRRIPKRAVDEYAERNTRGRQK